MTTEIYTTDTDSGSITVVERNDNGAHKVITSIAVGNAPRGSVKFTTDGRGYVSNCGGDTISEIDVFTHREISRIKVGAAPRGIGLIPGDRYALVSNSGSNYVSVVDLTARKEIEQVAVGRDPRHMAVTGDGRAAYVCIWGSHYVAKLDTSVLADAQVTATSRAVCEAVRIGVGGECHPYSASITPDGRLLFVANTQSAKVTVIDLEKDEIHMQINMGHKGARAVTFTPDGRTAFVSIEDTSEIVAISMDTMEVARRISVGPGPRGIAFDGGILYASAFARPKAEVSGEAARRGLVGRPNSLTVVDMSKVAQQGIARAQLDWKEVDVGKGPCSVSILHVTRPATGCA